VLSIGAALVLTLIAAPARATCHEDGTTVAVGAGVAATTGAAAAFAVAGSLAAADDTREFKFGVGAGVGAGAGAGLAALYALVDASTGCTMAEGGIVWSVPITTFVVGALLPVAIWGASSETGPSGATPTTSDTTAALKHAAAAFPETLNLEWRF